MNLTWIDWRIVVGFIALLAGWRGWVLHRYREARAMTMAQFFEMRCSRSFRIYGRVSGNRGESTLLGLARTSPPAT